MPDFSRQDVQKSLKAIRWPLRLTEMGMWAESFWKAFWPLMSVFLALLGALMLGLHDELPLEAVWGLGVLAVLGICGAAMWGALRYVVPTRAQVLARLDASLPGRPIQALLDDQAVGSGDPASMAVWEAHQTRMAERAAKAKAVPAKIRISDRDPFGVRFVAAMFFAVALLFGSLARIGSVTEMAPADAALASGPVWEGWAESPPYTRRPTIYLNDVDGTLELPEGSLITLRLYGEVGALTVHETVSARTTGIDPATDSEQDFIVKQAGTIAVDGPGGRSWEIVLIPDEAPSVAVLSNPHSDAMGEMTLPFAASDDYGVEAGEAIMTLNLAAVDRRHGLTIEPEARAPLTVQLPMPFAGSRQRFEETLVEDFSEHPWANLPVEVSLSVLDAAEQQTFSDPRAIVLPGRRFFDPLAASLIEQRRDLLWNRVNGNRAAQLLRAVRYQSGDLFRKETDVLRLNRIIDRMELFASYGMSDEQQEALAQELWALAIIIEEGDLASALERLRRAQERLEQAMREGASQAEIEELMRELRRATDDYLQQLSRQAQLDSENNEEMQQQGDPSQQMQLTQDDIQRMMERIQELMEQGRMAEAQQALQELQELLQNLQMQQAQGGQNGQQSPGEQAMEGLSETLREQQGLSDEAFRDLQEQFNPNAQSGQSQQNEGRDGGQGRGQQHSQSPGQQGQGQGQQQGQPGGDQQAQQGQGEGQGLEQSLADRQRALRQELQRQQQGLPGSGTPEGDAAREALDRAGRAMDSAEDALRGGEFAEAIDQQSQAMDALRDGIRELGEQLAEQQQQQQGQGQQAQAGDPSGQNDPLGRDSGPTNDELELGGRLPGKGDLHGRARDLLDEVQRRLSQGHRSEEEREYLERLLDRF